MISVNESLSDFFAAHARRSLDFDEVVKRPKETKPDRLKNGKKRMSAARRRLHFGETERSVLLSTPDLLPNRDDFHPQSMSEGSFRVRRTCLTFEQRTALEELFQRKMFPNVNEKTRMAIELGVTKLEIKMWFEKRRQLFKNQRRSSQEDESKLLTRQADPQTPFPRPFQNVTVPICTTSAQSYTDCTTSLPDFPRRPAAHNPSSAMTLDNSSWNSECHLLTSERATCKAKRVKIVRPE